MEINPTKVCSYNCIFCPLGITTRQIIEREEFFSPEAIVKEIDEFIDRNGLPDYIWLKGSGDPSLYLGFNSLTRLIRKKYPTVKIGSWLNGTLLHSEEIREDFLECDLIVVHLHSVNPKEFKRICRPHKAVKLENVIKGIRIFKNHFAGIFCVNSFFLNGINTSKKSLKGLKAFLVEISPDLYFVREFNNEAIIPIPEDLKTEIKELFSNLPFKIIFEL